eukprot:TRINITY_DN23679_c0_g3_i1.p1 TRINITY_DN23679_c0_g3~~TRINITY_DN23679_c0_g3_i1.p1  ORF type:complete len:803 (-),score=128.45 TRINITY_DN23679_c0_g3_i1:67-2475(-)
MGYRVGEHAGPYEVIRLLGRGTFGEVSLARDPRRPRHSVALKTVTCDYLASDSAEKAREAALAEARILRRLRHPHIVKCEEVCWDASRRLVWLALEFMEGGDAQGLIDAQREAGGPHFEPHFVRRVLASVGGALRYIHAEGVLHRDVKPANVLLARRASRIKLGDFGISKLLEATGRARSVVGTPYYLSPEIVSGQAYGAASDAWALGVCLFELAALRRPFEAGNALALVRRICEEPPTELPPETAPDLRQAILSLLERDPQSRLDLNDALAVSDSVAALVADPAEDLSEEFSQEVCSPSNVQAYSPTQEPSEELSPVSKATGQSHESSPEMIGTTDLLAAYCGAAGFSACEGDPFGGQTSNLWRGSEAAALARVALSADVDDPEELQDALDALEREASDGSVSADVYESLASELRLRIAALRADAAALLRSLLQEEVLVSQGVDDEGEQAPPTLCRGLDGSVSSAGCEVEALETAIELATSLGVDTGPAEERAASVRGLLSLRVVWGSSACICLLPVGVPFDAVVAEVSDRFGLPFPCGPKKFSGMHLQCREGSDIIELIDQHTWNACLLRNGLMDRPGRLELIMEVPGFAQRPRRQAGLKGRRLNGESIGKPPIVVTGRRLLSLQGERALAHVPVPDGGSDSLAQGPLHKRYLVADAVSDAGIVGGGSGSGGAAGGLGAAACVAAAAAKHQGRKSNAGDFFVPGYALPPALRAPKSWLGGGDAPAAAPRTSSGSCAPAGAKCGNVRSSRGGYLGGHAEGRGARVRRFGLGLHGLITPRAPAAAAQRVVGAGAPSVGARRR